MLTFEAEIVLNTPPSLTPILGSLYDITFISSNPTGSIYSELLRKTTPNGVFSNAKEIQTRKDKSLLVVPENREMLNGYFSTNYKYKKRVFSDKEINAYDQTGLSFKWKRGSQNKKTTVDATTGNLNNSDSIETNTA